MDKLKRFNQNQLIQIDDSVAMAEELVSNFYKMSVNQWLRLRYDIKTLMDLAENEIVHGPFAQVIQYSGIYKNALLSSAKYDFYKVCIQDHSIIEALKKNSNIKFIPFVLYIITHELIHIVRFSRFLQLSEASLKEKMEEESRVHQKTYEILKKIKIYGMSDVLRYYDKWL